MEALGVGKGAGVELAADHNNINYSHGGGLYDMALQYALAQPDQGAAYTSWKLGELGMALEYGLPKEEGVDKSYKEGDNGGGAGNAGTGLNAVEEGKTASNTIPNYKQAIINPQKFTDYSLNPDHSVGGNKAIVFEKVLGFNKSNADLLIQQVKERLPSSEAIIGKIDEFGVRYTVDIQITGVNGNAAIVRTGWIIETGSTVPRLVTIYVK